MQLAGRGGGEGGAGAGEGIPEGAAQGCKSRGQAFGVGSPAQLNSPPAHPRPLPPFLSDPSVRSQLCFAEAGLTWAVSPARRAETTEGGPVGSLLGRVGEKEEGAPASVWAVQCVPENPDCCCRCKSL